MHYLDLQNFSAASVTNFKYIFTNCGKLLFINLRKFKIPDTSKVALADTFKNVPLTTKYCIEDAYTGNYLLGDITVDCSDFCFQENVILDLITKECVCNDYYKFEYNNKCLQKCPDEMYHIMTYRTYTCSNNIDEN